MSSDLLGSAQWDTWDGVDIETGLQGNGIFLGCPFSKAEWIKPNKDRGIAFLPKRHFLSVAATRSGKGVSLIIPNLLQYGGSTIVIDPKGENAWITAKFRRDYFKQKTIILDPWNEVNRRYGDFAGEQETISRFNPLSILDPKSPHYAEDLAYLSDALIINQGKDPHWDDSARELVAGLMAYTVERFGAEASLPMMRLLLSKPSEEVAGIAKDAQELGHKSIAARKLGRFVNDSREISSIISTALTQTAFLDSNTLAESLSHSDFSFDDLVNGRATIYLVLPVDKLQTYGRWLRLLVSIGIRTVARNVEPLGLPVLFILDEFGTIGRLSAIAQAYGLMAGLQMCIWAFVQDLVQLKRDYPDDWETFIGNSEGVTFFNVMDQFTCEYVSRMLGTETVERISIATAKKRKGSLLAPGDPNYEAMADQSFARSLMHPEEIRGMMGHIGIYVRRAIPLRFAKIKYHEEKFFLRRARSDPHFPEMQKRQAQIFTEDAARLSQDRIPNFKSAYAAVEAKGYKIRKEGMISKKITVTLPDGSTENCDGEAAFIEWARRNA